MSIGQKNPLQYFIIPSKPNRLSAPSKNTIQGDESLNRSNYAILGSSNLDLGLASTLALASSPLLSTKEILKQFMQI